MAFDADLAHVRPRSRLTYTWHVAEFSSSSGMTRTFGSWGSTSIWGSVWMRPGVTSVVTWTLGVTIGPFGAGAGWAVAGVTKAATIRQPATASRTRLPIWTP